MRTAIRAFFTRAATISLASTLLACGSAGDSGGTFDNTGGPPPPGTSIAFDLVPIAIPIPTSGGDPGCMLFLVNAKLSILARTASDIPVIAGNEGCSTALRTALADTFASLGSDQAIGIFTLGLGGCVHVYEVSQVDRDGLVLRPWVILHDTSLGARNPACTADFLGVLQGLRLAGATGATSMELYLSRINPNYPRRSDVPVF